MSPEKFSFVILHYNSIDDTYQCVESIEKHCQNIDYRIYIVDNASPNHSGKLLLEKYEGKERIRIILSDENIGFAKGNNLGISQALKDGYADFVTVLNNDTKIIQDNFCEGLQTQFEKSNFAVLGPTIYTPLGKTSINPGRKHILQGRELDSWENFYSKGLSFLREKNFFKLKVLQKQMGLKRRLRTMFRTKFKFTENCVLHGCCLVLSKKFFEKFSGFDSRTFLYFEEEILYAHVIKSGLKTVYAPEIEIWHKEDGATDSVFKENIEKTTFLYENILKSIRIYKDVLKNK